MTQHHHQVPPPDAAESALADLIVDLRACIDGLELALSRAELLQDQRQEGRSWLEIVSDESRPLVVERVTTALDSLATSGSRWRREEALALQAENVSITRIAALFGVTRQRISALVRDRSS